MTISEVSGGGVWKTVRAIDAASHISGNGVNEVSPDVSTNIRISAALAGSCAPRRRAGMVSYAACRAAENFSSTARHRAG
jgi:hypothetical protein